MKKSATGPSPKASAKEPSQLFPSRVPLAKSQMPPRELLEDLRQFAAEQPAQLDAKLLDDLARRFAVFDRDEDGFVFFDELCELLVALGYSVADKALLGELFTLLRGDAAGVSCKDAQLFLLREKCEKNVQRELDQVFKRLEELCENASTSSVFREMLLYQGYKYTEEQADEFMRFADPTNEGKVNFAKFVELIAQTEVAKKKEKPKKK